jgi:hypothetical protein
MANEWRNKSDDDVARDAVRGPGNEPAARWFGMIESNRRVTVAVDALRAETAATGRKMERLTWWLVVLTVVLVVAAAATIGVTVWAELH